MIQNIKFDCKFFKGLYPCKPNKLHNCECSNCAYYIPISKRILIIKLGAIGDVIRTTPLIVKYREMYENCHITWITHSPDVLPKDQLDEIYKFDFTSVYSIQNSKYDIAINLDKEIEACALLKDVNADEKHGFIWKDNHLDIATPNAEHKIITGLYDHISEKNTKHYLDEIFEICNLEFNDEPYLLNFNDELAQKWKSLKEKAEGKTIVGLNTGCGKRWLTRLWPIEHWINLINKLQDENFYPVLLGGLDEHEKNLSLSKETNAYYPGTYSLEEFIALSSNCDIVVTQVSMMMHIAVALKLPMVLMNNIFNKHEFYLYNNGVIVEPDSGCDCFYGNTCKRERECMNDLPSEKIYKEIVGLANKSNR